MLYKSGGCDQGAVDRFSLILILYLSLSLKVCLKSLLFSEATFDLQQKVLQHPEVRMQLAGVAQLTTCNAHTVLAAGQKLWEQEGLQGLYRGRELCLNGRSWRYICWRCTGTRLFFHRFWLLSSACILNKRQKCTQCSEHMHLFEQYLMKHSCATSQQQEC